MFGVIARIRFASFSRKQTNKIYFVLRTNPELFPEFRFSVICMRFYCRQNRHQLGAWNYCSFDSDILRCLNPDKLSEFSNAVCSFRKNNVLKHRHEEISRDSKSTKNREVHFRLVYAISVSQNQNSPQIFEF